MRDVHSLLVDASRIYDEPAHGLQAVSRATIWRGFAGGADWIRNAMAVVRGRAPIGDARFGWLGVGKYALASFSALLVLAALWRLPMLAVPAAVVAFYAVEVRMVFAFPLALDGELAPLLASHRLVARTSPPGVATLRVMRVAAYMMFGGFLGRGFLRSWCVGCLAIVLWYEDARRAVEVPA